MQKDYELLGRSQTKYILKDDDVSLFNKNSKEMVIDESPAEKVTPRASNLTIRPKRSKTIRQKSSKKNVAD